MNQVTIRQISQDDIESLHSCMDRVARERKYLGFTRAAPIEEARTSLMEDMERGVIRQSSSNLGYFLYRHLESNHIY